MRHLWYGIAPIVRQSTEVISVLIAVRLEEGYRMKKKVKGKVIVALILVVAIAVSAYWFFFIRPYTNIVVGELQPKQVTINGVTYTFTKEKSYLGVYPWIETWNNQTGLTNRQTAISNPQQGETYPWLGIKITIVEIHEDRYVINVAPKD